MCWYIPNLFQVSELTHNTQLLIRLPRIIFLAYVSRKLQLSSFASDPCICHLPSCRQRMLRKTKLSLTYVKLKGKVHSSRRGMATVLGGSCTRHQERRAVEVYAQPHFSLSSSLIAPPMECSHIGNPPLHVI